MRLDIKALIPTFLLSLSLLTGCTSALIGKKIGSDWVIVVDPNKVSGCESRGGMTASVLAKVWFVSRSEQSVEENLLQMARNSAVEENADTIVKGQSKQFGERSYFFYRCR